MEPSRCLGIPVVENLKMEAPLTVIATHTWFRKTVLAVAATFILGGCVAPAYAHDRGDGDGWRRHEHQYHEHEWREHRGYDNYGNSYYRAPRVYEPVPNYGWYR